MKRIFILLFLLPLLSKAQVYQAMPQAGYGPVKRMLFDSVLTLPLGITKLQNITGGRDTGQIRYNKADSSIYIYSGNAFRKVSGGGGTTTDTTSLSNRINLKLNAVDTASLSNRIDNKLSSITATSPITVTAGTTPIISTSMATNKLIGRSTASTGVMEQITIGSGLTLSGGTLTNTATPTPLGYYGAFSDTTSQTAAAINTGYPMKFAIDDITPNGVSIVVNGGNKTRITFANSGIYNLQWSAQFKNTDNAEVDVSVWLRKNGVDIVGSRGLVGVPKKTGTTNGHILPSWNFVLDIVAGEYYEFVWSASNTTVSIEPFAATGYAPSTASTILTVTQQSGIMSGTGITGINSLTGAAQTMVTGTDSLDFKIVSTGTQHKFNIPSASTTARGVITTAAQTMAGGKTFTLGNQVAGWGVIGSSDNNDTEENYAGVKGVGLQSSKGVWGTAVNDYGLYGTSTNNAGVVARTSAGSYHAVLGDFDNNSTYITKSGRVLIKTNVDNTLDALQVNGNIKADNTRYIIKSAGAANSTTTLNSFDLNTPTLTAGTYRFSILIAYNAAATGTGARFVLDGTGTAPTALNFINLRTLTAVTQSPVFGSAYNVPATATASSLTTGNICKIEGVITLPSTAVLSVKFASSTTSAITVLAGSYFEYY